MDTEPSIVCGEPGGPHVRMRSVATIMLLLFIIGVPVAFATLLFVNRRRIVADQMLRVWGEGESALTNPNIHVRRRFRKLYEDYKPGVFFWKLVLLARKLTLALVVIFLDKNVEAQVCCGRGVRSHAK
jgi:hypothetical protein